MAGVVYVFNFLVKWIILQPVNMTGAWEQLAICRRIEKEELESIGRTKQSVWIYNEYCITLL